MKLTAASSPVAVPLPGHLGKTVVRSSPRGGLCRGAREVLGNHDILFASRGPFALTNGRLKGYAREIELDEEAFGRCLESGRYAQKVKEETIMGLTLGARATPVFLINDMMLVGAHPLETFWEIIEEELQASQKDKAPGKQK